MVGGECSHHCTIPEIVLIIYYSFQQALVGIAYSFGFIIGPVIGAVFAKRSSLESGNPYVLPALFAITLTVADILLVFFCLKETLPKEKRVNKNLQLCSFEYKFIILNCSHYYLIMHLTFQDGGALLYII